jgi:hypothetical protein
LRLIQPDQRALSDQQNQPVIPAQRIADVLSDAIPGQRIMAEIQALLPNGTYRALVAQREITLALPFSAKPGDSLELEVVESDGKVSLAVVTNRATPGQDGQPKESVSTTLSRTGQLIGDLLQGVDENGKKASPAPLNSNQPLLADPTKGSETLAPLLKEALTKSGVFYEAHQARWVAGELPKEQLLAEPQGKLSPGHIPVRDSLPQTMIPPAQEGHNALENMRPEATRTLPPPVQGALPEQLTPIVQQQLDALATQVFTWQGQAWPGQSMYWEIDNQENARSGADDEATSWKTRLRLNLPLLGDVDASLRLLPGNGIEVHITTTSQDGNTLLNGRHDDLKQQFLSAGLTLMQFSTQHEAPAE